MYLSNNTYGFLSFSNIRVLKKKKPGTGGLVYSVYSMKKVENYVFFAKSSEQI